MSDYDFDRYSGVYLTYPKKPTKPTLDRNPSAIEARTFADALEEYEREYKGYEEDKSWYLAETVRLQTEFKEVLKGDYNLSDSRFDVIWDEARSHCSGLRETFYEFDRLYNFASKVVNA